MVIEETKKIKMKEIQIRKLKKNIQKSNDGLMTTKMEIKFFQKILNDVKPEKKDEIIANTEKKFQELQNSILRDKEEIKNEEEQIN